MTAPVRLYDLAPSPNSMKVRIALNLKDIRFEKTPVASNDRAEVLRVSGQPLTPVLQHGDTILFDSAAILRYIDANFHTGPRLFSTDYAEMKQIEQWESIGRRELTEPISLVFGQLMAGKNDPAVLERASRLMNEQTAGIEEALGKGDWLVAGRMTAADITIAPDVHYGMLPAAPEAGPVHQFFAQSLKLGPGRDRTRAWVRRVMAYDR